MRQCLVACLLFTALLGCVTERLAEPPPRTPVDRRPSEIISLAPMTRARADAAAQQPSASGSFYRRVWQEEFERLLRPLRATGLIGSLPAQLVGTTLARWQTGLNEAWAMTDPGDARIAADAVHAEAAPMRDQVNAWVQTQQLTPAAIAAAISIGAILSEIVQESELLALRDSGEVAAYEAFVARYPTGPYTGSVLYALGAIHEERREYPEAKAAFTLLLERFPDHPQAVEIRQRLGAL